MIFAIRLKERLQQSELGAVVLKELQDLMAAMTAWAEAEHDEDGTHTIIHERGREAALGEFIDISPETDTFRGSGAMLWTLDAGGLRTLAYTLVGEICTVYFTIALSTVTTGGTPSTTLSIKLPPGISPTRTAGNPFSYRNVANVGIGVAEVTAGGKKINLTRDTSSTNWDTTGAGNTSISGQISFSI